MISIIIPVYNKRSLVGDTLRSVVSQSYSDLEILCVDDGSTDGSGAELTEWAGRDKRIRVLSRENGGLSAARNTGLDAAKGEWVAFLDAGDVIHPEALERLEKVASSADVEVAVSRSFVKGGEIEAVTRRLTETEIPSGFFVFNDPLADLLRFRYAMSSVCNKLYRRDAIGKLRFQEGLLFEDWPFLTKLFGGIERFALVAAPLYGYVTTLDSITRSEFSEEKIRSYVAGIESVHAHYSEKGDVPRAALKRCAVAAKMMLGKVWHSRDIRPELQSMALLDFWRLVREKKIRFGDVALKAVVRAFAMHHPVASIWIVASVFWLTATALFTGFYPVWMPDVVVRYGPMADAFAAGDWEMAFHPRFGVLFQVLTGIVRKVTFFDGLQSCQCVAAAFWAYSVIPLWAISKRMFGHRAAILCAAFLLIAPRPFGLALDGLRDDGRLLAMLLCALAFIDGRSICMAAGAFILLTLRVDCYFIGSVMIAIWICRAVMKREWTSVVAPVIVWLVGTAAIVTMIHHYTGHWVPAVQLIKYVGGWL